MPRDETQHGPLSAMDEHMIHQYPEPLRVMYTSDARAYERYWFTAQDKTGDLFLVQGCGFYPSLDTTDAYATVVYQGQHTTVRAYRSLGDDRMNLRLGPINAEVIEPFREWRLTLGDNDQQIGYDLRWHDTKRAVFHRFGGTSPSSKGRHGTDTAGYESFGEIEGWVDYKGRRFTLDRATFNGSRDHHWGTRNAVGGPGHNHPGPAHAYLGQWVEFKDWSVWGNRVFYNIDDARPGAGRIVRQQARLRFDPQTRLFVGGVIENMLDTGESKTLEYERIKNQTMFLRCGGYGGPNGGTPDKDIWHGMYMGEDVVEGETYDLNDPAVQIKLAGNDDHHCVVTCDGERTIGIFESYEPALYEFCQRGVQGFSLL